MFYLFFFNSFSIELRKNSLKKYTLSNDNVVEKSQKTMFLLYHYKNKKMFTINKFIQIIFSSSNWIVDVDRIKIFIIYNIIYNYDEIAFEYEN